MREAASWISEVGLLHVSGAAGGGQLSHTGHTCGTVVGDGTGACVAGTRVVGCNVAGTRVVGCDGTGDCVAGTRVVGCNVAGDCVSGTRVVGSAVRKGTR